MTMVDLFEDPQLVKEVTAEFNERKGSGKYEAMIPPGPPPVPQK
jgi:aminobenzoyl-glutamate utilization protein B